MDVDGIVHNFVSHDALFADCAPAREVIKAVITQYVHGLVSLRYGKHRLICLCGCCYHMDLGP